MAKLHVFGVTHTTGKGKDARLGEETTNYVSALMKRLKKKRVKKLGVEYLHADEQFHRDDSTDRYWKAVFLRAKRMGIELVNLEDEQKDPRAYALTWLQQFFNKAILEGKEDVKPVLDNLEKMREKEPEAKKASVG